MATNNNVSPTTNIIQMSLPFSFNERTPSTPEFIPLTQLTPTHVEEDEDNQILSQKSFDDYWHRWQGFSAPVSDKQLKPSNRYSYWRQQEPEARKRGCLLFSVRNRRIW